MGGEGRVRGAEVAERGERKKNLWKKKQQQQQQHQHKHSRDKHTTCTDDSSGRGGRHIWMVAGCSP